MTSELEREREIVTAAGKRLATAIDETVGGAASETAFMALMCVTASIIVEEDRDGTDGEDDLRIEWLTSNLRTLVRSCRSFARQQRRSVQ